MKPTWHVSQTIHHFDSLESVLDDTQTILEVACNNARLESNEISRHQGNTANCMGTARTTVRAVVQADNLSSSGTHGGKKPMDKNESVT
jgi:hypothetical protein